MMRASDLQGKHVRCENGASLGRVYEIRLRKSQVVALICGARGFFQRLADVGSGHRVPWERVHKITTSEIIVADKGSRPVQRHRKRNRR
jgi:sporulation protein YlmC with PRC-barrel domain